MFGNTICVALHVIRNVFSCFYIIWIISRYRHAHIGIPWLTINITMVLSKRTHSLCTNLRAIAAPQFECLTVHLHSSLLGCFNYPHPPPSQPSIWPTSVQNCYGPGGLQNAPYPSRLERLWSAPCPTRMCRMPHFLHCSLPITDRHTQPMEGMGFLSRPACTILLVGSILSLFWKPPSSYHAI